MGNTILGDTICKSLDYKSGNTINFVVSFAKEDGLNQTQGRKITKDFMQEFMHGFAQDEYHVDMVEHNDTDNLHYHLRIPKLNLLTSTQLKLYWHKSNLGYKKAVIDAVADRYNLIIGTDKQTTLPNTTTKLERINAWRFEFNQKSFDLSKKRARAEAESQITNYISQGIESGLIDSLEDIKAELSSLDFNVCNEGFDKTKEFHYLTIENESGKIRLKGDIYGYGKEDRIKRVSSNSSTRERSQSDRPSLDEARATLSRERKKRLQFISKQYARARERAREQIREYEHQHSKADARDLQSAIRQPKEHTIQSPTEPKYHDEDSKPKNKNNNLAKPIIPFYRNIFRWSIDISPQPQTTRAKKRADDTKSKPKSLKLSQREQSLLLLAHQKRVLKDEIENRREKRRQIDDRVRREIKSNYINTATELQARVREYGEHLYRGDGKTEQELSSEIKSLRAEHQGSQERDSLTEPNITTIRGNIKKLAYQYQRHTVKRIGEHSQAEGRVSQNAIEGIRGGVRELKRESNEHRERITREVERLNSTIGAKSSELERGANDLAEQNRGYLQRIIEKIREVGERVLAKFRPKPKPKAPSYPRMRM